MKGKLKRNTIYLKGIITSALLTIAMTGVESCNSGPGAGNETLSKFQDSLLATIKTDTTYKVKQVALKDSIIEIAVSSPDADVLGHFNIYYNLNLSRVPYSHEDSVMPAKGIIGIEVYTDTIEESKLYKDLKPAGNAGQ